MSSRLSAFSVNGGFYDRCCTRRYYYHARSGLYLSGHEKIRIVEIGDIDKQADGGTHVASVKEVGRIELAKIEWAMLSVPVVSNVEAEPMKGASSISGLLVRQLTSPVRWVDIIKRMKADGVTRIMETGPGKALTGLIKRIEPDILTVNLGEAADVDKAVEAARGS